MGGTLKNISKNLRESYGSNNMEPIAEGNPEKEDSHEKSLIDS